MKLLWLVTLVTGATTPKSVYGVAGHYDQWMAPSPSGFPTQSRPAPLDGLTVVDMGQVLATPFGTYLLALLGARVIKIEPPHGEFMRAAPELSFATQNAGKESIVLDMWESGSAEKVLRLCEQADIFVEGFAPGVAASMGLGWDDVRGRNAAIVYGSLSAFGDAGPYANRPGFDHVVQAISGIMPATGFEGQPPTKVGAPFLDYGGGLLLAFGVLAGVLEQRRTGNAVQIDVTMLDAGLLFNAAALTQAANHGTNPPRTGNSAFSGAVASGAFDTADGILMVAANKASHFVTLMNVLGLDELAERPDLARRGADPAEVAAARDQMTERFLSDTAQSWEARLCAARVPAAYVRDMAAVAAEGHLAARQIVQSAPGQPDGPLLPSAGVRMNGIMFAPSGPAPTLGQHSEQVLAEFGITDEDGNGFAP